MSLERERAIVEYDPRAVTVGRMLEAVRRTVILPGARRAIERKTLPRRSRPTR